MAIANFDKNDNNVKVNLTAVEILSQASFLRRSVFGRILLKNSTKLTGRLSLERLREWFVPEADPVEALLG